MYRSYKLVFWNANGILQHLNEIKIFLRTNNIDIMLISETHLTSKSYVRIPNYTLFSTNHPDNRAHGGTAVIVLNKIKHHESEKFQSRHIQATSIVVEDANGPFTVTSVYCPPRFTIKSNDFQSFYSTLGNRFIAGGDYNAKHNFWGSRLITTKGRELYKCISKMKLDVLSTGEPTYWPSDRNKIPEFCTSSSTSASSKA